jgi:FkbM family methyltransferase
MKLANLRRYAFLAGNFRNGLDLIRSYRSGSSCPQAVMWNGIRLSHPADQGGLVGTILELWHDQCYTAEGFYQPAAGDVILDVGAHVGLFSCWAVRHQPAARVFAIEPCSENFRCLMDNLTAAGAHQVTAWQRAVGSGGGHGVVHAATNRSIDHRLVPSTEGEPGAVPVVSLLDLVEMTGAERVAFLKMDVEGAEYDAFGEADQSTLARIDRIALEYHDNLRPGTLALLRRTLAATHEVRVIPTEGREYGVLLARRHGVT